jgi:tetratricopeptide (TPR) repeat protein
LLELEDYETAAGYVEEGNQYLRQGTWHQAVACFQTALDIVPDWEPARLGRERASSLSSIAQSIVSDLHLAKAPVQRDIERLLDTYSEVRSLSIIGSSNAAMETLIHELELKIDAIKRILLDEVKACFLLVDHKPSFLISSGLLRRAHTLLSYVQDLPGESKDLSDFWSRLHRYRAQVELAQEFELALVHQDGVLDSDGVSGVTRYHGDLDTLLTALDQAMQRLQSRWRDIWILRDQVGFCYRALACQDPTTIADFLVPDDKRLFADRSLPWMESWRYVRSCLCNIVEATQAWLRTQSADMLAAIDRHLEELSILSEEQITPLNYLSNAIAFHWSLALKQQDKTSQLFSML